MRNIFFILIGLFLGNSISNAQITKVLFIGNSYTGVNNLPQLTFDVANSTNDTLIIDSHTPGGQRLMDHAVNPTAISKIYSNDWDYVVLQAQSQEPSWPIQQVQNEVFAPATKLCDTIRANNVCSRPVFYMTWGRKNGDAQNCPNWPPVCTYTGMDSLLNKRYQTMGEDNDAFVSPVGAVWHYIRDTYPQIELYAADESHPSIAGSYAAACTFYSIFLRKDPTLIMFEPGMDPVHAENIRKSVQVIVYDSLLKWNVGKFDPVSDFSFSHTGTTVQFSNLSVNADSFLWNFGDGDTSMVADPIHIYSTPSLYTLTLKSFNCGMVDTKIDSVALVMGIEELATFEASVYPNPTSSTVSIKVPTNIRVTAVDILDNTGKTYLRNSTTSSVNLKKLPSGLYWIKITTENNGTLVKPILKK